MGVKQYDEGTLKKKVLNLYKNSFNFMSWWDIFIADWHIYYYKLTDEEYYDTLQLLNCFKNLKWMFCMIKASSIKVEKSKP